MLVLSRFISVNSALMRKTTPQVISVCNKYRRVDTPAPDPDLEKTQLTPKKNTDTHPLKPLPRYDPEEAKYHPERAKYPEEFTDPNPKGLVYDKRPIKIPLEAGRIYSFCTCGYSKKQPFCDGKHKTIEGTTQKKYVKKFRPMKFSVQESKDYFLCNCKQSDNRPYCDGSHKRIDEAPKTVEELEALLDAEEAALEAEIEGHTEVTSPEKT